MMFGAGYWGRAFWGPGYWGAGDEEVFILDIPPFYGRHHKQAREDKEHQARIEAWEAIEAARTADRAPVIAVSPPVVAQVVDPAIEHRRRRALLLLLAEL